MIFRLAIFMLGAATATVAQKPLRAVAKKMIGAAMTVGDGIESLKAETREDLADAASARRAAGKKQAATM